MNIEKELVYAYVAGGIDADGHIIITRSSRRVGEKYAHRPTYYSASVGYTSIDETVPMLMLATFGGRVNKYQSPRENSKPVYIWACSTQLAASVVTAIRPYLRVKGPQADILLKFVMSMTAHRKRDMSQGIPPEAQAEREELWKQMSFLNGLKSRKHTVDREAV